MNSKVDKKNIWGPQEWEYLISYLTLEYSRFMMTYWFTVGCHASSWTFDQCFKGRSLTNSWRNGLQKRRYNEGEGNQTSGFVPRILPAVWWRSPVADLITRQNDATVVNFLERVLWTISRYIKLKFFRDIRNNQSNSKKLHPRSFLLWLRRSIAS